MRRLYRFLILAACTLGLIAFAPAATAGHENDPHTANLQPRGHIVEPASLLNPAVANPDVHTDIAFWGQFAFQGNWDGFNIRNIADSDNPTQVSRTFCDGNQGDVVVWDDILVRSWNTPAGSAGGPFGAGTTCDGQTVPSGFEGLHVFDISNLANPELVASVETECGSHTATGVPDLANNRLLIYNSPSSGSCPGIDIVQVPLDAPQNASFIRFEPGGRACHDTGVILGKAKLAACAGGDGWTLWSLGGASGGSLEDPLQINSVVVPTVTVGHSAAFSWDGKVLIFGHEPGGGIQAECEATDDPLKRSLFFYSTATGNLLGTWTLPRTQSSIENCTIHNYNVVPLSGGRDVLVHGSYQSGTSVVEFTNPASAVELGWSDPPPIVPADIGGAWSSYWYNNFIQETNITEGLNVFRFSGRETAKARRLDHLNPQTQEFTIR